MPIVRNLEALPPRKSSVDGAPPSSNNFVALTLAESWYESDHAAEARGDLALAIPEAGPYRASFGSVRCDRALWYALTGVKPEPPGLADVWRFGLGHKVHEMLQDVITDMYPDAEAELDVDLRPAGVPGSAHVDVVINHGEKNMKLVIEVKTKNGFQFKKRATKWHGAPEGPDAGELIQAGFAAEALGADGVVILYLALENVGAQWAHSWTDSDAARFAAEWHYTTEELKPLLDRERERIAGLLKVENPPPRAISEDEEVPAGAVVTDPSSGMWVQLESPVSKVIVDSGDTWRCAYCSQRAQCIKDGA